jgi:hypothetical protein
VSTKSRILAGSLIAVIALSASALLLTGRSATAISTEETLRERVSAFWQSRVSADWVKEYDLMSPDLREITTLSDYVSAKGFINYYAYEIERVEVNGDSGRARVRYTWRANHPAFSKASPQLHTMEDDWVRVGGTWFKKYVPPSVATPKAPVSPWDDSGPATRR